MPFIDKAAGHKLVRLREAQGVSPEAMADEIRQLAHQHGSRRGTVDAYTIRRAERGLVPTIRPRFVIANYFGVDRDEIWQQDAWVKVDANRQPVAA